LFGLWRLENQDWVALLCHVIAAPVRIANDSRFVSGLKAMNASRRLNDCEKFLWRRWLDKGA